MPKASAVTYYEGGPWEPWPCQGIPKRPEGLLVHSILFEDGSRWDAFNGWTKVGNGPSN